MKAPHILILHVWCMMSVIICVLGIPPDIPPQVLVGRKALSLAALACLRSGLIVVIMVDLTNLTHFLFAQWYGRYVSDTCQRTFIVTPVWFPSESSGLGWLGMGHGVQQPGYTDPTNP